jgi:hypothetical protein
MEPDFIIKDEILEDAITVEIGEYVRAPYPKPLSGKTQKEVSERPDPAEHLAVGVIRIVFNLNTPKEILNSKSGPGEVCDDEVIVEGGVIEDDEIGIEITEVSSVS